MSVLQNTTHYLSEMVSQSMRIPLAQSLAERRIPLAGRLTASNNTGPMGGRSNPGLQSTIHGGAMAAETARADSFVTEGDRI